MKNFIKILVLILVSLFIFVSCKSDNGEFKTDKYAYTDRFAKGPISLNMGIDNIEIDTAGKIKIFLEGRAADGWKPSFPELLEDLDKFTVVSVSDTSPRLEDDGSIGINRTIILKPYLSGEYTLPPLSLNYSKKDEGKGFLLSTPVLINVKSMLPESTDNLQLKDIKEPDTYNYLKLGLYILIAVVVLGAALIIFMLIRKRKKETPGIPPYKEAFDKLTNLLGKNLPSEGRYKEFYFQLNLIVRIYIEKQFSIRAPEQTTEEFLQDLAVSNEITDEFKLSLKNFLIHSDLVKFARHKPVEEELSKSIESCKNFIRVTGEML